MPRWRQLYMIEKMLLAAIRLTLIIAEEEDAQPCQAVDSDEQLPLLQFVHDIVLGYLVHTESVGVFQEAAQIMCRVNGSSVYLQRRGWKIYSAAKLRSFQIPLRTKLPIRKTD